MILSKFDRKPLAEPMTYRVVFRKVGNLQFFSHLDLQRTWQRVLVRASIPMWYTLGFNPHAKIVYGVPLPVGTEGLCEMVDLRIDREITAEEMKAQLNAELTDEMAVSDVYVPEAPFADIAWATYEYGLSVEGDPSDALARINALFNEDTSPIMMTKRTKSGDKEVDIRSMIRSVRITTDDDENGVPLTMYATLASGNSVSISPEFLITAIRERLGLLTDTAHPETCWYTILRTGFLREDGSTFR